MARIRTIKPEFFTSEDIVSISPLARLLYIATWCEADKEGRLAWKPRTLKMRYLPSDNCNVDDLCAELTSSGLVVLYGDGLAHIPGFAKHQHVNPRESKSVLPEPTTHVDRKPSHIPRDIRDDIMARDEGRCVRCGSDDHPQLDHILPQSCGGPHVVENLRVLCRSCNAGRPVSGKGLDDDLAKDGLSLKNLRVKFGVDASNLDLHAQVGREGKGREGNSDASRQDGFEEFWEAYPSKKAKPAALKAFKTAKINGNLPLVLAHIGVMASSEGWTKNGGQFVPMPATYLNQRRWEDDAAPNPVSERKWI
ncbi:MAG: hypothetical protein B7Y69_09300 [Sphingobacteriia bacterium 35-40-8]|jgi:hypothetical protein|nr:MAG: hypothetical protein B7Y69_09300 [Sphingobacteriia bacterium 35-40-8]